MSQTENDTKSRGVVREIEGRAVPVRGDDIDTDRIIPARFLRCVTFDGLGEHAFRDDREGWDGEGAHPFDRPEFQGARILIGNANFGCGSSREHAPQSLARWGIGALIAESFAEIFFGNCVSLGIPCVTASAEVIDSLQARVESDPTQTLAVDVDAGELRVGDDRIAVSLPEGARHAFLTGLWDSTGLLIAGPEDVDRVAAGLPYIAEWSAG